MLETPHVALGIAIATKIPNPVISIPLSFASHFLLEKIPHWNPHLNRETKKYGHPKASSTVIAAIDASIAYSFAIVMAYSKLPDTAASFNIMACAIASSLPDLIEAPYFFLGVRHKYLSKWISLQKSIQEDAPLVIGLLTQIAVLASILYWIFN